jgi:hypothetical protein
MDSLAALVVQAGDDVLKAPFDHSSLFRHRFQAAAHGPIVPLAEVAPCQPFIEIIKKSHHPARPCSVLKTRFSLKINFAPESS